MRKIGAGKTRVGLRSIFGSVRSKLRKLTSDQRWAVWWIIQSLICCILAVNGIGIKIGENGLEFSTDKPESFKDKKYSDNGSFEWKIER